MATRSELESWRSQALSDDDKASVSAFDAMLRGGEFDDYEPAAMATGGGAVATGETPTRAQLEDMRDNADEAQDMPSKAIFESMIDNNEFSDYNPEIGVDMSNMLGAAQGATFYFGDEISGAVRGGLDTVAGGLLDSLQGKIFEAANPGMKAEDFVRTRDEVGAEGYTGFRDQARQLNQESSATNPYAHLAGEVGAGLAVGIPGAAKAMGMQTFRQAIPRLAGVGAAEGTLAGTGYSAAEDVGGMAQDAAMGTVAGTTLGVALPGAMRLVGNALRGARNYFRPQNRAIRTIEADLKDAGLDMHGVDDILSENPNKMLADTSSLAQDRLAEAVSTSPGAASTAGEALTNRNLDQLERLRPEFQVALGSDDVAAAATKVRTEAKEIAKPLYDQAYKVKIKLTGFMQDVLDSPMGRAGQKAARTEIDMRKVNEPDTPFSAVDYLDHTYRAMRDRMKQQTRAAAMGSDGMLPGAIAEGQKTVRAFAKALDDAVEAGGGGNSLAQARKVQSDRFANEDALEVGRTALRTRLSDLRSTMDGMGADEMTHVRIGIFDDLMHRMGNKGEQTNIVGDFSKPDFREKVRLAFGDADLFKQFERTLGDERVMFNTMKKALRQMPGVEPGALAGLMDTAIGSSANLTAGRHAIGLAETLKGLANTGRRAIGIPAAKGKADYLAELLTSTNPRQTIKQLQGASARPPVGLSALGGGTAALNPEQNQPDMLRNLMMPVDPARRLMRNMVR